jgi:hypothetical protein
MQRRLKQFILISLTVGVINLIIGTHTQAHAISAEFMEGQFEPVMEIGNVTKIEAWEQPRTRYTPANLKSEYQIRYSGTNSSGKGSYSYTTHFTDYDTTIKGSYLTQDGKYYITDTAGRSFYTGEHVDLTPVNSQMSAIKSEVDRNSFRINKLEDRLESGLATVSALTALHPNPRSHEKLEVAVGAGMYADNVAGAIGVFYHPNDRVMISAGASYGGDNQFAGNFGITFSLGRKRK